MAWFAHEVGPRHRGKITDPRKVAGDEEAGAFAAARRGHRGRRAGVAEETLNHGVEVRLGVVCSGSWPEH